MLNSRLTSILAYNTFIILIESKLIYFYFVISKWAITTSSAVATDSSDDFNDSDGDEGLVLQVRAKDKLLCFGNLSSLSRLMPI
jgi:hypothetical protein